MHGENGHELLTDLYQLTMAQGYWETGQGATQACFHAYFRDYPFRGGYAIACGMDQLAELIDGFSFSAEDVDYLASLDAPGGGRLFKSAFLEYLRTFSLRVDIDAVAEGAVVFPHEPIVRVMGPIMDCQLIETALLNCVNFETLIATKAARVCLAAHGLPVAEFGLRRAQGAGGGMWASRAAVVGGCASTSNVLAGKTYGLPVSARMRASWVMSFPELEAFPRLCARVPRNCVLLVDTYDVEQGIRNAITVGLEMRARGERLAGIRIDSTTWPGWRRWRAACSMRPAWTVRHRAVQRPGRIYHPVHLGRRRSVRAGVGTKLACAFDQPHARRRVQARRRVRAQGRLSGSIA